MRSLAVIFFLCAMSGAVFAAEHALPENVAILVNASSAESVALGEHYRQARGIPAANVCQVATTTEYEITMASYVAEIRDPFKACLEDRGLEEQILFVAVTYGIPAVIGDGGAPVLGLGVRSLDSFLVDPFDEIPGDENPYFGATDAFLRENGYAGYLVTRLDGPSVEVARALVDRAGAPGRCEGIGWFDQEPYGDTPMDREVIEGAGATVNAWIEQAYQWISDAGWEAVLDTNDAEFGCAPAPLTCPDACWYMGWYQAFHYNDAFQWAPGAVGIHVDSFSAMNYREEGSWCAGALEAGITATAGSVWEPYIQNFIHGHRFLRALSVDGFSLAEAAYQAIPRQRWMIVVFGDPLYAPSREAPLPRPEPPPEVQPEPLHDLQPRLDTSGQGQSDVAESSSSSGGCGIGGSGASGGAEAILVLVLMMLLGRTQPRDGMTPGSESVGGQGKRLSV